MKRTVLIRVIVGIVLLVAMSMTYLTAGKLELGWLKFFSGAVFLSTVLLGLWESWLWRLPIVQRIPTVPVNVRGTWEGILTSFWVNPDTGTSPAPKTVYLVVRQTASLVSVKLLTNESRSSSSLGAVRTIDHSAELIYMYLNRPDIGVQNRSRMHHGSTALDISGRPAARLKGSYWTDRDSKGELNFIELRKKLVDDFDAAANLFAASAK